MDDGAAGQQITLRGLAGAPMPPMLGLQGLRWEGGYAQVLDLGPHDPGPVVASVHVGHGRGARGRSARGTRRPLLPAGSARVRPLASRRSACRGPLGDYPAWVAPAVGFRAMPQGHLGDRGARELALGCRRSSDGADPHRRRLPDAGRHLPQRPGSARRPQRQAALRPHRVGGPRGDGAVRPRPGLRRRRARRLLDGRRHRSWPSCSVRIWRPGACRDPGRADARLLRDRGRQRRARGDRAGRSAPVLTDRRWRSGSPRSGSTWTGTR